MLAEADDAFALGSVASPNLQLCLALADADHRTHCVQTVVQHLTNQRQNGDDPCTIWRFVAFISLELHNPLAAFLVDLVLPFRENSLLKEMVIALIGQLRWRNDVIEDGPKLLHSADVDHRLH